MPKNENTQNPYINLCDWNFSDANDINLCNLGVDDDQDKPRSKAKRRPRKFNR